MGNTVSVNIAASDNGSIDKITTKAKGLTKELKNAQAAASGIGKPASSTVAYSKAKSQTDDMFEYRQARGGRGTGAEGRDFAKQAQGLGGLVHVYATFAANIFAVTAAFMALSKAADYTNMVKGLDQLGAASGRNLGYMSKQVVSLTDNAVSLKEAMATVAQTSAAGMSGEQIERLAVVAKQTSIALGRDMGDSLNRLSRGISKIEPELLDELGIFVKIDKAASDYARTIGKTSTSLTDFERRQAYATAALSEAEKKFGSIDIDANPYSKLQSSFINILYSGGELINKVLTPIVKLLASSPAALATTMALIAGVLLKQAIPALTQWRTGLAEAADVAEKKAKRISDSLSEFKFNNSIGKAFEQDIVAAEARSRALKLVDENKLFGKKTATVYDLNDKSSSLDTAKEQTAKKIRNVTKEIERQQGVLKSLAATEKEEIAVAEAKIKQLSHEKSQYALLAVEIEAVRHAKEKAEKEELRAANPTLEESIRAKKDAKASKKAESLRIRAQVVNDTETMGAREAYKNIGTNIAEWNNKVGKDSPKSIGALQGSFIKLSGAISIAANVAGAAISAFSVWAVVIGAIIGAMQLLNSWLTTNSHEQENYTKSIDRLSSSSKLAKDTLAAIADKPFIDRTNLESLSAASNALKEVGDSALAAYSNFKKVQSTNSGWSQFTDSIFSVFNMGDKDKLADNMADAIISAYNLADKTAKEAIENKVKGATGGYGLTGISKIDIKTLKKVKDELNPEEWAKFLKELGDKGALAFGNISSAISTLSEASKSYDNVVNSLNPSDAMSKMAMDSTRAFSALTLSMTDSAKAAAVFKEISTDFSKLRLLPEDSALKISKIGTEMSLAVQELDRLKNKKIELDNEYSKAGNDYNKRSQASRGIATTNKSISNQEKNITEISIKGGIALREGFIEGAKESSKIITMGLEVAFGKAGLMISQAAVSGLGTGTSASTEAKLKNAEIDLGLKQLESQIKLVLSQESLKIAIEANTLQQQLAQARTPDERTSIEGLITHNTNAANYIKKLRGSKKVDYREVQEEANKNPYVVGVSAAYSGAEEKRAQAAGQKGVNTLQGKIQDSKDIERLAQDKLSLDNRELALKKQYLNLTGEVTASYSEQDKLSKDNLNIKEKENIEELKTTRLKQLSSEVSARLSAAGSKDVTDQVLKFELQRKEQILREEKLSIAELELKNLVDQVNIIDKKYNAEKKYLDLIVMRVGLEADVATRMQESGLITKGEELARKEQLDLYNLRIEASTNILALEAKLNQVEKVPETVRAGWKEDIEYNKQKLKLGEEKIIQEAAYQKALVSTEDYLKNIDKGMKVTFGEVGKAGVQDFANKIHTAVAASKSSIGVLNDSIVSGIDSSIDKITELFQKGELTSKNMGQMLEETINSISSDMLAQSMKNAVKTAMTALLPQSEAQKEALNQEAKAAALRAEVETSQKMSRTSMADLASAINIQMPNLANAITGKIGVPTVGGGSIPINGAPSSTAQQVGVEGFGATKDLANSSKYLSNSSDVFAEGTDLFNMSSLKLSTTVPQASTDILAGADRLKTTTTSFGNVVGQLGPMIGSLIGGLGGGGSGSKVAGFLGQVAGTLVGSYLKAADGGVFNGGMGLSAHSNSIVSSPTTFAFAKGGGFNRGLMGEAGPEAIMPLQRNASGSLGVNVSGNAPKVDVVVINNSNSSAETKETMDSRGNRRVEVVIGEMVSSEMSRNNSSMQNTMKNVYGSTPVLTRR